MSAPDDREVERNYDEILDRTHHPASSEGFSGWGWDWTQRTGSVTATCTMPDGRSVKVTKPAIYRDGGYYVEFSQADIEAAFEASGDAGESDDANLSVP